MTVSQFIERVEEYFGGKYNTTQNQMISRWASKRSPKTLDSVFDMLSVKKDWMGKLPLVSSMHAKLEELGIGGRLATVPDDRPQKCRACGNEFMENQNEVQLCRVCHSMWLWMDTGVWAFAKSQRALLGNYPKAS